MWLSRAIDCLLLVLVAAATVTSDTTRPIVGILSLPLSDTLSVANIHSSRNVRYPPDTAAIIPASYVKWLEQSGARVAVIPYNSTTDELSRLWNGINGLLFTGGGLSLAANTTYFKAAKYLYDKTIAANQQGDHFAIWGTCQGFQLLNILASSNHSILQCIYDSENLPLALDFADAATDSRLFGPSAFASTEQDGTVWTTLSMRPSTINLHQCGVSPQDFEVNAALSDNYDLLSTNTDRKGQVFVSSMEHKTFPIFAAQWHAERPQFEWDLVEQLDKTPATVRAMQYISDIFVRETRKNSHKFDTAQEEFSALIYNFAPIYTGNDPQQSYPDQQTYVWF